MLLSIGMMVKNEEKNLEACLKALKPILNSLESELIIVDTGSTDRTVEIAKKYTDKVYFHKWNNNFSEMRNITINYCTGDWFFCVDGDEILENCDDIIKFFNNKIYKKFNSAAIYIKNFVDIQDESKYGIFAAMRLFKKDKDFKFVNVVHNQPIFKQPSIILKVNCKHYGYINTDKELMEKKFNRTVGILKNELSKDPSNIYYLFQLAVSYAMHGDYKESVESIQRAYDCMIEKKEGVGKYIYLFPQLCSSYYNVEDYLKMEKYSNECLKYNKKLIDIYYYLGVSSMYLKKNDRAIWAFESYLELYENYYTSPKDMSIIDTTLCKINQVYYYLYFLNKDRKEYEKAKSCLLSITDNGYDVSANMVDLCIKAKQYHQIKSYEENLILNNKVDDINKLHNALENAKMEIDHEEAVTLTKMFSSGNLLYNNLNRIKLTFENEKNIDVNIINSQLEKIDLSSVPFYYGDLIYYLIYGKNDVSNILGKLSFEKINEYFGYLTKKHNEFDDCVYDYVLKFKNKDDMFSVRINKEICRYLILHKKLEKNKLENIYNCYLETGTKYIKFVYSDFVVENECWQVVRTEEERFFIYIIKAKQHEESDKKVYLKYLSAALNAYPYMKDLIEYLLSKVKQEISGTNSELENYKVKVKSTIKTLIASGNLYDAKSIIDEYESIVPNDIEIVLFKSQISLKEIKNEVNSDNDKYKM